MYQNCPKLIGVSIISLKPCPFCGSVNVEAYSDQMGVSKIICADCGSGGPTVFSGDKNADIKTAAIKWNDRL